MTPTENEMTPAGAVAPNRSGVASGTIPEAVSSTTGVSLRYAPVPKGEWFVFRASYNRELKAADFILNEGIYAYVPQQYVWKEKDGKPKKELKSLISCIPVRTPTVPIPHSVCRSGRWSSSCASVRLTASIFCG